MMKTKRQKPRGKWRSRRARGVDRFDFYFGRRFTREGGNTISLILLCPYNIILGIIFRIGIGYRSKE